MRKANLLFFFLFLFSFAIQAQRNGSVKGVAFDTISKQPLAGATVTVLERKDSSLVSFTMTGSDGKFELNGLGNGEYRLLITHVNYYNSNRYFTINDAGKSKDLGQLVMNDKSKVLEEVVLSAEAPPVTLINDTIQYNAGSFKVQPNASVEQLLKKLPGVKVEKDGTIKAQGEKVSKVLVDGKEFFGDDPKVATKNLPADAIDKVQVYDKQSDQAQLTGFEDGNYEKTINLKLKKDKKKGVFGKATAGGGNKDRYEGKFNVNSFKGARQLSAIGMGNNTNAEGFSFMDILNFTGELARMQKGGGGNININISQDDAAAMGINAGNNSGINTAWGGGLNYNNIIGNKLDFQSNYFYNRFNPNRESHIQRQYLLPDSSYFYNQDSYTDNLSNTHRFNLNTLYQVDSFNSIRINPSFNYQRTNNRSRTSYQTLSEDKILTNEGFSNTTAENDGYNFRTDMNWRRKFRRKGRTFSLYLQTTLNSSTGSGSLSSINKYYDAGVLSRKDTLNQQNQTSGDLHGYTARAVYTEPLWKRSLLEFSAGRSNTKSTAVKTTYDFNAGNGKFDQVNNELSNDYENTYGYTTGGLRLRTQRKKFSYALGATWQKADLEGKITSGIKDSVIGKSFTNVLPNARFQYNFSRFKSLSVSYSASTNQPSMSQLQPVPDNSIPLYIRQGNPDLKQEFTHAAQVNLNLMSPYKNKNLFLFLNGRATQHRIVSYDSMNLQTGVRTTRPVNVNGVYNVNSNLSYSFPVHFLKGSIEWSAIAAYSRNKQLLNDAGGHVVTNDIRTTTLGPGIRVETNPIDKINISLDANLNYNHSTYSLQSVQSSDYLSQDYGASLDWELPKGFFFSSDFTYTINSQRATGYNTKVPLWNVSISKQMLRFNRGELKFSAQDLLNRNVGISRNTNNNYIEDSRVLTLRRFFLLSFTYSLSKTGLNRGGGGGMRVIAR